MGSDPHFEEAARKRVHFNPRSPCGERQAPPCPPDGPNDNFNPRSPCGERPSAAPPAADLPDFNPRSPCGERRGWQIMQNEHRPISIHAPRVGSDTGNQAVCVADGISIHAPRVGSDSTGPCHSVHSSAFQSTLPVWGATLIMAFASVTVGNFNPRSPCGERHRQCVLQRGKKRHFNPRSPCGERLSDPMASSVVKPFQSTLPVWGATRARDYNIKRAEISIHAPRVGSDSEGSPQASHSRISIHAPRVGSDLSTVMYRYLRVSNFNPRSPCGERRVDGHGPGAGKRFQSTLPVWGATGTRLYLSAGRTDFNPRSPCGERQ